MPLSYHKLVRAAYLVVFSAASAYSIISPQVERTVVAGLALVGLIAYDIVCTWKDKNRTKDYGPEIAAITEKTNQAVKIISEMKDDVSVAKLANTFRR